MVALKQQYLLNIQPEYYLSLDDAGIMLNSLESREKVNIPQYARSAISSEAVILYHFTNKTPIVRTSLLGTNLGNNLTTNNIVRVNPKTFLILPPPYIHSFLLKFYISCVLSKSVSSYIKSYMS